MDLRSYLDDLPPGGVSAFAKTLGIGRVYLSQLAAKHNDRRPSPELCVSIERESAGKVRRTDLRDDWAAIWPELIPPSPTPQRRSTDHKAAAPR